MSPALLIFGLLWAHDALAATYGVRWCVEHPVLYDDTISEQDWFDDDDPVPARGIRVKITNNATSAVVHDDFAEWDGLSDAGCTDAVFLDSAYTYEVRLLSQSKIRTDEVSVYTDDVAPYPLRAKVVETAYSPSGNTTESVQTNDTGPWRILAAASFALYRHDGGVNGNHVLFDKANNEGGSGQKNGEVHLNESLRKQKIVHEQGHLLQYLADPTSGTGKDYTWSGSTSCPAGGPSHGYNSLEFQKAALLEGFADFYAAITFNDEAGYGCYLQSSQPKDWDCDNDDDEGSGAQVYACDGAPRAGVASGDHTYNEGAISTANVSNEWDWLRQFWDLVSQAPPTCEGPVDFDRVIDLLVTADVPAMNKNGTGSGAGYPAHEMSAAAYIEGFPDHYDDWASDNGVDR